MILLEWEETMHLNFSYSSATMDRCGSLKGDRTTAMEK